MNGVLKNNIAHLYTPMAAYGAWLIAAMVLA